MKRSVRISLIIILAVLAVAAVFAIAQPLMQQRDVTPLPEPVPEDAVGS